jgi:hypothetical protein
MLVFNTKKEEALLRLVLSLRDEAPSPESESPDSRLRLAASCATTVVACVVKMMR